jgi:hypothetical protein
MTEVIAGQSVALLSQWYDFEGGSLVDLDATPSITIVSIASGTVVVAPTTSGVTHPGTGSYGYAWTPAADLTPGDYLATWSGLKAGSPVTAAETITVTEPISGRSYATADQLAAYLHTAAPANAAQLLEEATVLLDSRVLRLCWYEVDDAGLPTNSVVATAFARAVCAQARWWDELGGSSSGADAAGWGSVKIGSVQLGRSVTSVSGADSPAQQIAPAVWDELRNPLLTPDIFVLGMVVQC